MRARGPVRTLWAVVLLAGGCVRYFPEEFHADAYQPRWELPAASPWAGFSRFTITSGFDEARAPPAMVVPHPELQRAAERWGAAGLDDQTLWLIELPGAKSVELAAALTHACPTPVAPVLTFGNWPADDELIPTRQIVVALNHFSPHLSPAAQRATPVFLLDADRLADAVPGAEVTDNRYALRPGDFPSPEYLLHQGLRRVIYLVDGAEPEQDDLNAVLLAYQQRGLAIARLELSQLSPPRSPGPAQTWAQALRPMQIVYREPERVAALRLLRSQPLMVKGRHSTGHSSSHFF